MALSTRLTDTGLGVRTDIDTAEAAIDALEVTTATHTTELAQIAPEYGNRFVRALGTLLSTGETPACILAQGDSTSVGTNHWYYLAMLWLASLYPAYTAKYRLWNDTNQAYASPSLLQHGTAGDGYALLPGASGSRISTPSAAPLQITGDIDLRVKINFTNWAAGIYPSFINKLDYQFGIPSLISGTLYFYWYDSSDGLHAKYSSAAFASAPSGDISLRVTLDVDNGASGHDVKFYTSTDDGATWTQLGATQTTANVTDIRSSATGVSIGSNTTNNNGYWSGRVYWAQIMSGIDGTVVASPDFGMAQLGATTITDAENNVWTLAGTTTYKNGAPTLLFLNASIGGKTIAYGQSKIAIMSYIDPQLIFVNYGHNETTDLIYADACESHATALLSAHANAGVVFVAQNPQKESEVNEYEYPHHQALRMSQVAIMTAKNNYGLIDAFRAFMETTDWEDLIDSSGVHPTDAGHLTVWLPATKRFLSPLIPRS